MDLRWGEPIPWLRAMIEHSMDRDVSVWKKGREKLKRERDEYYKMPKSPHWAT
jgi:hypothetical protein